VAHVSITQIVAHVQRSGFAHDPAPTLLSIRQGNRVKNHAAIRLTRNSSSHAATLRLRRKESLPGALGLGSENAGLKKLLADAMLDNAALKDLLAKNSDARGKRAAVAHLRSAFDMSAARAIPLAFSIASDVAPDLLPCFRTDLCREIPV
jgi:hypothetical protein